MFKQLAKGSQPHKVTAGESYKPLPNSQNLWQCLSNEPWNQMNWDRCCTTTF